MKVRDLIEILKTQDPDTEIAIQDAKYSRYGRLQSTWLDSEWTDHCDIENEPRFVIEVRMYA